MAFKKNLHPSLRISIIFFLSSILYIFLSDRLILWTHSQISPEMMTFIQTAKGTLFISLFAVFLFYVSRHYIRKVKSSEKELTDYQEHLEEIVTQRTREIEKKTLKLKISQQSLKEIVDQLNETTYKLRESNFKLEKSNNELESFAYTVSHDLRAPLRSINGFSKALMEDCHSSLEDHCKDYLQRVYDNTIKMELLINEILTLSRISSNPINITAVNVSELAGRIVSELRETNKDREVNVYIEDGLGVMGDKNLINILFFNLIDNAWKFTSINMEAEIKIGTIHKDDREVIFISDNGVGFDMKHHDKIFEPFQRLQQNGDFPGTGIGLATVNRIVTKHNGLIWAKSEKERGATFYIQL